MSMEETRSDDRDLSAEPSREDASRPAWGENLSERRRTEAVALVQDRVTEIVAIIGDIVPRGGIVTGAATCAEVRLDDAEVTHRFLRIALVTSEESVPGLRKALRRDHWRETPPGTDSGIISIAHAHGRRPHFVVLDGGREALDGPEAPHPASEEGREIRRRRLQAALTPPILVLGKRRRLERNAGADLETLEVQVRTAEFRL